ncbi:hypothetical protein BU15DRAFT_64601 [Melanogaster broomeanus]|nr:hypothetical protein BU15DRAFT_64601 [Melanogaster broomeanus]
MVGDPVSFTGDTRYEVISVLANCGSDTDKARRALVTWISRKQNKGRSTEHILNKLNYIESKARPNVSIRFECFIKDVSLHSAFREARAATFLPRPPGLPLPESIRRSQSQRDSQSQRGSQSQVQALPREVVLLQSSFRTSGVRLLLPHARLCTLSTDSSLIVWVPTEPHRVMIIPVVQFRGRPLRQEDSPICIARRELLSHLPRSPPYSPTNRAAVSQSTPQTGRRVQPANRRSAPSAPLPPIPANDHSSHPPFKIAIAGRLRRLQVRHPLLHLHLLQSSRHVTAHSHLRAIVLFSDSSSQDRRLFLPRAWHIANPDPYLSEDVVRGDSPLQGVYGSSIGKERKSGTEPPPPYIPQNRTYPRPDPRVIGAKLERALKVCGVTPAVRQEVMQCLRSESGYEPPYWQARLQDCGLNPEAVDFLVEEMTRQVDWANYGRET